MKRKIIMAVSLVLILSIIGISVYLLNNFFNSPEMLTKKYSEELGDIIKLEDNKKIIRVIKEDINNDEIEDYIVLYGIEQYSDVSAVEGAAPNLEMYQNVGIQYINGENSTVTSYETNKNFDVNVDISVETDTTTNNKYIFLRDSNTGNICLLYLKDGAITDMVKESFGDNFVGYMISTIWDSENTSKLKVTLNNEGVSYLPSKTDEYIIDFSNTKINQASYRQKYVINKFNYFLTDTIKLDKKSKTNSSTNKKDEDTENNNEVDINKEAENSKNESVTVEDSEKFQIIGVQNILYINSTTSDVKNEYKKAQGKVKTIFEIVDGKLVVKDVIVEK